MRFDFYATARQYADHLLPIWQALTDAERGVWQATPQVAARLRALGVPAELGRPRGRSGPVVVAAQSDYSETGRRPVVYVEHGAGQTYPGDERSRGNGAYSGGARRDRTVLFIVPSERVAANNRAAYPSVPNAVVGSPRLDRWLPVDVVGQGAQAGGILLGEPQGQVARVTQQTADGAGGVVMVDVEGALGAATGVAGRRTARTAPPVVGSDQLGVLLGSEAVGASDVRDPRGVGPARRAAALSADQYAAARARRGVQPQALARGGQGGAIDPVLSAESGALGGRRQRIVTNDQGGAVHVTGYRQPTVAVSFHWDCRICPEASTAWPHYNAALPELVADLRAHGIRLLGHGHPRIYARLADRWRDLGVELAPEFDQVLAEADLYVCDNSSTLYEFAATGRPVLLLNAPWYRRDVEHGLRFWQHADVGLQVDEPGELAAMVRLALADPEPVRVMRAEHVAAVYPHADGRAAERAADAMRHLTW